MFSVFLSLALQVCASEWPERLAQYTRIGQGRRDNTIWYYVQEYDIEDHGQLGLVSDLGELKNGPAEEPTIKVKDWLDVRKGSLYPIVNSLWKEAKRRGFDLHLHKNGNIVENLHVYFITIRKKGSSTNADIKCTYVYTDNIGRASLPKATKIRLPKICYESMYDIGVVSGETLVDDKCINDKVRHDIASELMSLIKNNELETIMRKKLSKESK